MLSEEMAATAWFPELQLFSFDNIKNSKIVIIQLADKSDSPLS
jgi:hypothetical protein